MKGAKQLADQLQEWAKINAVLRDWRNITKVSIEVTTRSYTGGYKAIVKSAEISNDFDGWDFVIERTPCVWMEAVALSKTALEKRHAVIEAEI